MRTPSLLAFGLLLLAAPAGANPITTYPEDPYNSKGLFENIRNLSVNPQEVAKRLQPETPAEGGEGTLTFFNSNFCRVNFYVNGVLIGDIESVDTAVLHGLKPGVYDVVVVMPTGMNREFKVATDSTEPPQEIVPTAKLEFRNLWPLPLDRKRFSPPEYTGYDAELEHWGATAPAISDLQQD